MIREADCVRDPEWFLAASLAFDGTFDKAAQRRCAPKDFTFALLTPTGYPRGSPKRNSAPADCSIIAFHFCSFQGLLFVSQ